MSISQKARKNSMKTRYIQRPIKLLARQAVFVNFTRNHKQSEILSDEWKLLLDDKKCFQSTLQVKNLIQRKRVSNLLVVHTNLRIYSHLHRVLYIQELNETKTVTGWPICYDDYDPKIEKDRFEIQFTLIDDGDEKQAYISAPLDVTLPKCNNFQLILRENQQNFVLIMTVDQKLSGKIKLDERQQYNKNKEYFLKNGTQGMLEEMKNLSIRAQKDLNLNPVTLIGKYDLKAILLLMEEDKQFRYDHLILTKKPKSLEMTSIHEFAEEEQNKGFESQPEIERYQLDQQQGQHLGNCYFIACIDQIITKADFILDLIWLFESVQKDYACAILNLDGRYVAIPVNFKVPTQMKKIINSHMNFLKYLPSEKRRFQCVMRAILLEKCLASIFNGYQYLNWGLTSEVYMMLISHPTSVYQIKPEPNTKKFMIERMEKWNEQLKFKKNKQMSILDLTKKLEQLKASNQKFVKEKELSSSKKNQQSLLESSIKIKIRKIIQQKKQLVEKSHNFLTISNFQLSNLKDIFNKKVQQKILKKFMNHTYSFQGIFWINKQQNCGFIKLKDPRGSIQPDIWKNIWNQHNDTWKNFLEGFNYKSMIYQYRQKMGQKKGIKCFPNQFIMSVNDFFQSRGTLQVCQYFPNLKFDNISIMIKEKNATKITFDLPTQGACHFTLHQRNKRRDLKWQMQSINKEVNQESVKEMINNWKYLKTLFEIELEKNYLVPDLFDHDSKKSFKHLQCNLEQGKHSLRLAVDQPEIDVYCLTIMSQSRIRIQLVQIQTSPADLLTISNKNTGTIDSHNRKALNIIQIIQPMHIKVEIDLEIDLLHFSPEKIVDIWVYYVDQNILKKNYSKKFIYYLKGKYHPEEKNKISNERKKLLFDSQEMMQHYDLINQRKGKYLVKLGLDSIKNFICNYKIIPVKLEPRDTLQF